jgi:hypothetical protein
MTAESDLDLLLVRPDDALRGTWDEEVGALVSDVSRWTGNDTRPLEYSEHEVAASPAGPVLRDVLAEGLTVAGSRAWLISKLTQRTD